MTFLVQDEPESTVGRLHVALILDVTNFDPAQIAAKMQDGWFMLTWDDKTETVWFNDANFSGSDFSRAVRHAAKHHDITGSYLDFSEFFKMYKDRVSQTMSFRQQ